MNMAFSPSRTTPSSGNIGGAVVAQQPGTPFTKKRAEDFQA
jgi:hypothetical protein